MKKKLYLVIPFLVLVLVFGFALACGSESPVGEAPKIEPEIIGNVVEEETVEEAITKDEGAEEEIVEENDNKGNTEIKYEIIYTLNHLRYDDAITYYVLIDPIDLSDDIFKDDIKEIIRNIVEEKGNKITIEIFDKRDSLENGYKDGKFEETADLEGWDNWFTDKIANDLAIHCIASYDGRLETGLYLNTLYFFIYSESDNAENPEIDKYVDIIQFNP